MAVYDGFFDAVQDEDTGEYDRAYSAGDFTQYFGQFIGSGVCIHENPDSFKVRLEDGAAIIGPGYLFIQGYWLKNDADYAVTLPASSTAAIAAHLNLGKRMIEIEARAVAQVYPDSLVLAIVDTAAGTVEDTRHNIDICGVIDSSGSLSGKVEYAVNYIDKEINTKLEQIEKDIAAQEKRLDKKIEDVQAVADSIVPPPIGSIKFSAAESVGPEWLKCDGSYINQSDYPELVELLRKPPVGPENLHVLPQVTTPNYLCGSFMFENRLWVMTDEPKLYGLSLDGGERKEISVQLPNGVSLLSEVTLSLVEITGIKFLYLMNHPYWFVRSDYNGETNKYDTKISVEYYFFRGFSSDLQSISFQSEKIEEAIGNSPIIPDTPFRYYLSYQGKLFHPVMVFDSAPYVALGDLVMSTVEDGKISNAGNAEAAKIFVVAVLQESGPRVQYHMMERAKNTQNGSISSSSFRFESKSLEFYSRNGGALFKSKINYAYELVRVEGSREVSLARSAVAISPSEVGILGRNQLVTGFGVQFSSLESNKFQLNFIDLDPVRGHLNTVNLSTNIITSLDYFPFGIDAVYLPDNNLWAFFQDGYIIFLSNPLSSESENFVLDIRDKFNGFSQNSNSNIFFGYDEFYHKLYLVGKATNYHIKSVVFDIPAGYSPLKAAQLPSLSMNNIPAYIKAKEAVK